MYLQNIIKDVFEELEEVLLQVSSEQYSMRSRHLNSSVGQHVRHTIELFQSLVNGYETGVVNYDKRKRDSAIETDIAVAIHIMHHILAAINKPGKKILLESELGMQDGVYIIESNFDRELAYNLEHAIHHMALIRVGINELTDIVVPEKFGVAPSTIKHRAACVQ